MKKMVLKSKILICILLSGLYACTSSENMLTINDNNSVFSQSNSPVSIKVKLPNRLSTAAKEGRLVLSDPSLGDGNKSLIPAQLENPGDGISSQVVMIMPTGSGGIQKYKMIERDTPFDSLIKASLDPNTGQVIIDEDGKKILQYNYQTIYEKDVIRLPTGKPVESTFYPLTGIYLDEYLKENSKIKKDTSLTTSVYAVPRSDYIHPLYGLEGEMLTRDWPDGGHPHHRGIFWAWPEVEYGSQRGDLYALQRVFARPTGKVELMSGPVFAQIAAENVWMWENTNPIVRENVVIRVYHATSASRIIDLTIRLDALEDSITIATRGTNSYGGLNLRMMTPESQDISYFTDQNDSQPLRAWSDFNGVFEGNKYTSGLMVLQHKENPEYPGTWAEYPDLAWVQPTFPTPGTRYHLDKGKSLILRYRLIVHSGGKPDELISKQRWDAFNATLTPLYTFNNTGK